MSLGKMISRSFTALAGLSLAFSLFAPGHVFAKDYTSRNGVYNLTVNPQLQLQGQLNKGTIKHAQTLGPSEPKYKMNVTYNSTTHQVNGQLTVQFKNTVNKTLNDLYFNLWGNADMFTQNGGGMSVDNVKVNGNPATYDVNKTKLHITGLSLENNKPATTSMDFTVTLPNQADRFGWYGTTVSLGNWFPILGVYDEEGWNVDPYYNYGESFYSLTGDFDVTLTTDSSQVIATSGTEIGQPVQNDKMTTHHYKAHQVRDFAIEMDPTYHVISTHVNNTKINVYYTDKQKGAAEAMLESGHDSIALFSEKFGEYPWPELDIVSMEGWFGGMEYPQLVMISLPGPRSNGWVKSVTSHEIGHQWFYGVIGDNEYDEPWLDESFASFSAALYDGTLDHLTAEPPTQSYYHLSSPVSTFTAHTSEGGISAYYRTIYDYGSRTLNDLRLKLGDDVFYQAMHEYFHIKKFGVSTTADFIHIMEKASGQDLTEFFNNHRVFLSDQE